MTQVLSGHPPIVLEAPVLWHWWRLGVPGADAQTEFRTGFWVAIPGLTAVNLPPVWLSVPPAHAATSSSPKTTAQLTGQLLGTQEA